MTSPRCSRGAEHRWPAASLPRTLRGLTARVGGLAALVVAVGNLALAATWQAARRAAAAAALPEVPDVHNLQAVDARLWRGSAPSPRAYRALAGHGVTTVVDLRAERGPGVADDVFDELGITRLQVPIRDGGTPSPDQVRQVLAAVAASRGRVYLHCAAGVGRTGTVAASYLVATGQAGARAALRRNLTVGCLSMEQVAYVLSLRAGAEANGPHRMVRGMSRVIDAPRLIWARCRALARQRP